jgi:hypothetical protein
MINSASLEGSRHPSRLLPTWTLIILESRIRLALRPASFEARTTRGRLRITVNKGFRSAALFPAYSAASDWTNGPSSTLDC